MSNSSYNIVLMQPPGYPHAMGLWDICQLLRLSLTDLGYETTLQINRLESSAINVIVGYHLIGDPAVLANHHSVIYQLEQVSIKGGWFKPSQMAVLGKAQEIWDYGENITFLNSHGLSNIKHLPIGFHEGLATIPKRTEDIDVLFYGTLNERRKVILDRLRSRWKVETLFNVYGKVRDAVNRSFQNCSQRA